MAGRPSTPRSPDPPAAGDGDRRVMRRRILDAALDVLHRHGAERLTVRSVADGAGCSTTGVYTYFGGKDGLVDAIFVEGFEGFDRAQDAPTQDGDLLASGVAYRAWAVANPTHYLVMFGGAVPGFRPSEEAVAVAMASYERLVGLVQRWTGRPRADAEPVAHHLHATLHGYVMLEIVGMSPAPPAEHETRFLDGLRRVLPERADGPGRAPRTRR